MQAIDYLNPIQVRYLPALLRAISTVVQHPDGSSFVFSRHAELQERAEVG